ncbi:MAG: hypothetical protein CMF61_06120 [Magnetococcales bacterium]|nr:hypothetical protein [Magnetococcales bacterium]|tara:strand:+ start:461 stop:1351 length:891 start_codon:yes stop_codon:yes gene_type:complete
MAWIIFALGTLGAQFLVANWNRGQKLEPLRLNFWRSIPALLCFSPAILFPNWPTDSDFYIACIIIGICSTFAQLATFHLSAKYNGRVSLISTNFAMLFTYITWIVLDLETQTKYIELQPVALISAALVITAFGASFFMRQKNRKEKEGYLFLSIVIGAIITIATIVGKKMLPEGLNEDLNEQLLILGFIIFLSQWAFTSILVILKRMRTGIPFFKSSEKYFCMRTVILGLLGAIGCFTSWGAVALAPNPAFVNAIVMTAPLIFLVYHKILKVEDNANPIAGTIVALCALMIIIIQS